ncbi:MAG: RluA family pseudouridine synthase [Kiritimatiellae bacterium]|nr:RluA family pseudouridine synthase [Kiritimatiellia bacterium]
MIEAATITVEAGGVRLDAVLLARFPASTRAFVREAIAAGEVLVDGRRAVKGLKLKGGETVTVRQLAEADDNRVAPDPAVHVKCVFKDDHLLAFDKPRGQSVQPLSRHEKGTLMNGVVARFPECALLGDRPLMAGALHRIDGGTSGLVLVARTAAAFDNLRSQFKAQTVEKTYLALVEGTVAAGGTLEHDLMPDRRLDYCKMVPGGNLHAVTAFAPIRHVMAGNEPRTLLEVKIFTGVTHQIRAQLALAGMHIVNDRLYGAFAVEHMEGHCLHALAAKFVHPVLRAPAEIRTPYPDWAL